MNHLILAIIFANKIVEDLCNQDTLFIDYNILGSIIRIKKAELAKNDTQKITFYRYTIQFWYKENCNPSKLGSEPNVGVKVFDQSGIVYERAMLIRITE